MIFGRDDIVYVTAQMNMGSSRINKNQLKINDRLQLVPGHCDPLVIYIPYVCVRDGVVRPMACQRPGKAW